MMVLRILKGILLALPRSLDTPLHLPPTTISSLNNHSLNLPHAIPLSVPHHQLNGKECRNEIELLPVVVNSKECRNKIELQCGTATLCFSGPSLYLAALLLTSIYRTTLPLNLYTPLYTFLHSQVNGKEFRNEIELLSAVRHRNLGWRVVLRGECFWCLCNLVLMRGFCMEAGEQLLVYEFIEKANLEDILRGKSDMHLTGQQRLDIACGAARGFAELHHQIKPPIIHRDVKTANILITAAREAKVADFGISKAMMEGEQLDMQVKGTMGYPDPECYMSDLLTERSDVTFESTQKSP
ncbi:unnamed protein product [Closterium sp. Yama58-4]|nr:unnamed protein product [Closterium sp. Yama58-4]